MSEDALDGCELDFGEDVTKPEDVEALLVPAGEEQDSDDA